MADTLESGVFFTTTLYRVSAPQYLAAVREVSDEHLKAVKAQTQADALYPALMTPDFATDTRIKDFAQYVSQTAWNILQSQGYAMENMVTYFTSMWAQEHPKTSAMDYHVHPYGTQINAFYFLDCPENGSQLCLHDPRPGKIMGVLPEADNTKLTDASSMVFFKPEPGILILTNAWAPHSFTRNGSDKPVTFVHMNLATMPAPPKPKPEVI